MALALALLFMLEGEPSKGENKQTRKQAEKHKEQKNTIKKEMNKQAEKQSRSESQRLESPILEVTQAITSSTRKQ